jgi:2-oxoglutarate/2-oxoacid ferredoxin oxidoreductase subunit beta
MNDFEHNEMAAIEDELQEIKGALVNDTLATLSPAEPVCMSTTASVHEAIERMLQRRQACVLVVDGDGRLVGIFTERDVLMRVAGRDLDTSQVKLGEVMTRDPEALSVRDRVAYALHSMSVAGYRTIPLVDRDRRPIGVITVTDVIRWLADMFPEAVLNLRPGDALKRPNDMDAG